MADKDGVDRPDDFDQLLRQELSIEPSPAFAARVRERIAAAPHTPWWRARWIPAVGSFAVLAALAMAVTVPALKRSTSPPIPPSAPPVRVAAVQQPGLPPRIESPRPLPAPRVSRSGVVTRADLTGLPEVIVDTRHRAALSTLFRMMDAGRVSGDSFAATIPVSMEPIADQMGAIIVAPVFVSAMPTGGVLHNENER